jgi:hypothetical protein
MARAVSGLTLALVLAVTSFAQQLAPAPQNPAITAPEQPGSDRPVQRVIIPQRAAPVPIVLHIAVNGSDNGDGSPARPFQTLSRAQAAVRLINLTSSVTVQLGDGAYRLAEPLRFTAQDGGHNSYVVIWEAAPGPHPVITGGTPVTTWRLADATRNIWVANIPRGADPRQLWVNNRLAERAGDYDQPVTDLQFRGLSFQHTSWLEPSGAGGYASQQSGAFLAGEIANYPGDAIRDCSWGCWAFEATRNHWRQQPAAVQVAAASRIVFAHDEFTHLGQVALGIGTNADANSSGIGLGVTTVEISRNHFSDLAGGAIMVGGITPEAHHPSRPQMAVRDILIRNNVIENVSQNYREQAAVLITYATASVVVNNDISAASYDGIDIGWGWGINDPGGTAAYRTTDRGYYDQPGSLTYDTPTILRDSVVFANRVHDVKRFFPDGGAIYHLSADPGALIRKMACFHAARP